MKKKFYTVIFGTLLCLCFAASALGAELIIVNASKFPINSLRLTNIDTEKGYNLLDNALAPQEALKVRMPEKGATWNIMAVDPNGSAVSFENINLTQVQQLHIFGDGTMEIYR